MAKLRRIVLKGFRSIREMDLELCPLNVLIGANGAGKSNLLLFFKLINEMMGARLQEFVAAAGRAHSLLYLGPKVTPQMEASLEFEVENGRNTYSMRLFYVAGDTLVFAEELFSLLGHGPQRPKDFGVAPGHQETRIFEFASTEPTVREIKHLLNQCRVYHFHDTSPTARVRQYCYAGADRGLMPDAANLAAILHRLRNQTDGAVYQRIVDTVRLIAPFFDDFELEPSGPQRKDIILNWRQKGTDLVFGPHQLSDGTLRAICLVTLLLQPADDLPDLIVVDEPELGLHPDALNTIAALLKRAAHHVQLIVSTQSSPFLDHFAPEDVVVVDRRGDESCFRRLDPAALDDWLEEYSLGQVWEKNVIGGGRYHGEAVPVR